MLALNGGNLPVPILDYTLVPHNICSLSFFFNFSFFLIEIQWIYNVVLISAVQQCDSVIHYIYIYIL